MIKLIIFDADGVLIHTERFSNILDKEYGISLESTKEFFQGPFQECRIGNLDLKEAIEPYLPKWGWEKGVEAFLELWFNVEHNLDKELVQYIQELRKGGVICVLGSNQEKYRLEYMLEKVGLKNFLDNAYGSAHIGVAKPDHQFFKKVISDHPNIKNNEVLLVDDREENVKAAEEFGMHGEFYTTLENLKKKVENLW